MISAEHSHPHGPPSAKAYKVRFEGGRLDGETKVLKGTPGRIPIVHKSRAKLWGVEIRQNDFMSTQAIVGHGMGVNPEDPLINYFVEHVRSDPGLKDATREEVARGLENRLPKEQLETLAQPFLLVEERVYYRYRLSHMVGDVTVYKLAAGPVPLHFNEATQNWDKIEEPDDET